MYNNQAPKERDFMLTTDRGQEISIIDKGIQINSPESTQVINFADIDTHDHQ